MATSEKLQKPRGPACAGRGACTLLWGAHRLEPEGDSGSGLKSGNSRVGGVERGYTPRPQTRLHSVDGFGLVPRFLNGTQLRQHCRTRGASRDTRRVVAGRDSRTASRFGRDSGAWPRGKGWRGNAANPNSGARGNCPRGVVGGAPAGRGVEASLDAWSGCGQFGRPGRDKCGLAGTAATGNRAEGRVCVERGRPSAEVVGRKRSIQSFCLHLDQREVGRALSTLPAPGGDPGRGGECFCVPALG